MSMVSALNFWRIIWQWLGPRLAFYVAVAIVAGLIAGVLTGKWMQ
jgi:hypothetical protein